jgi:hypothetical protein
MRILRLLPASDESHDVECELRIVKFSDDGVMPLDDSQTPIEYEAVSWCWGSGAWDQELRILDGDSVYGFMVSVNLLNALQSLRRFDAVRPIWIDRMCINQQNIQERNEQVAKMDKIYGHSKSVCVWLGEGDDDSKLAINFIKERVLKIWDFDELVENRSMARHWKALITLMKKTWFSRRWVVQEIALSPGGGTIYCGSDSISWQDFADAVSLFVEVETATHRLSDVMKTEQLFDHIPDFFGDVTSLGAALLVEATSNLFRSTEKEDKREPLSSLEYLVSRLSIFESTQPRDTIYALLAISYETKAESPEHGGELSGAQKTVKALAESQKFAKKPYKVDYKQPVLEVFKEFIDFSIMKSEKTRALDIICRPWAPIVRRCHDDSDFLINPKVAIAKTNADQEVILPSWIPSLSNSSFEMEQHPTAGLRMERQTADSLVGFPGPGRTNYRAAGMKSLDPKKLRFIKWESFQSKDAHYPEYSMFVEGFILDEVSTVEQIASNGNMPFQWLSAGGWENLEENPPEELWRTVVADRGSDGDNPRTYYPRAFREAVSFKAKSIKTKSRLRGMLDSKKMINEGRCTIVADFLRRVQAVIWNRLLIKTADKFPGDKRSRTDERQSRLGLVRDDVLPGFKICILYGCSVPVVLQEVEKSQSEIVREHDFTYETWLKSRKDLVILIIDRLRTIIRQKKKMELEKENAALKKGVAKRFEDRQPHTWDGLLKDVNPGWSRKNVDPTWNFCDDRISVPDGDRDHRIAALKTFNEENPINFESQEEKEMKKAQLERKKMLDLLNGKGELLTWPFTSSEMHSKRVRDAKAQSNALRALAHPKTSGQNLDTSTSARRENTAGDSTLSPNVPAGAADVSEAGQPESSSTSPRPPPRPLNMKDGGRELAEEREAREKSRQPPSKYYRLFGECYVHGMMNGEAIALQNKREQPQQVFEIR